ncbi:hypothetical protein [Rubritalea sp.]|uniref:hypothetical protein n=1 Tax=Rubritalea sp. TaxID=2109375 RepID=UPI003EFA907B
MKTRISIELILTINLYFIGDHLLERSFRSATVDQLKVHLILLIAWTLLLSALWCSRAIFHIRTANERQQAEAQQNAWKQENRI